MAPPPIRRVIFACLLGGISALAAGPEPEWPEWRDQFVMGLTKQLKALDEKRDQKASSPMYHSHRADLCLFLADFPEAVAEFEKLISGDPAQESSRWRLGIAYYFNGQYAKAQKEFEKYHAYDGHDRENGIWKFLAQERVDGMQKARAEMLTYTEFDREPFPSLYEMYAGKRTPEDVLAEIDRKGLSADPQVAFFGNYYTGLYEALVGHQPRAIELLRKAVEIKPGPETVYMWNVARLHWERLVKERARVQ